ncbi:hypothetical protein WME76_02360 [Sorangium sp. So ce119]|uniref:hypothetical protein n=1 Tax=Sorangium sp. So ce119 TaxID=3133279 RepID=UPI003F64222D
MDQEYVPPQSRRPGRDSADGERRSTPRLVGASEGELRALELAASAAEGVRAVREDLAEIKALLGRAPSPGHDGAGLVGAVSEMQASLARLDPSGERRPPARARKVALEAARGRDAAAHQQTTER